MKYLLVLYPITPYIETRLGSGVVAAEKQQIAERYQAIMDARYRDFQRVCVFFSRENNLAKPDLSLRWRRFRLRDSDIVGACGVSFESLHTERLYPKEEDILALCTEPIEKLVITGFHLGDCVDRVAGYAHRIRKLPVTVDEDLADGFFCGLRGLHVPFSKREGEQRTKQILRQSSCWTLVKRERKARPWMTQL